VSSEERGQRVAAEMRMPRRLRHGPDVGNLTDPVYAQQRRKLVSGPRRMPDGENLARHG
jgi:hypothetical protein